MLLLRLLSRRGCLLQLALLARRIDAFAQRDGFGACRIEIMRTLRDLLLQIGNLTPLCLLCRLLFRDGGGWAGRRRPCRGCGELLLLRLAKLVQRVDVLSQLAGFGVRRIEIVRALRDLLLKIGILTPQCVLRRLLFRDGGGGWTGRGWPCRGGRGDLLLLRLAKLVKRVDILPQLAGFSVRRLEIVRTLRDLLLQIGNLTAHCVLRRLLFRDGGGGWTGRGGRGRRRGDLLLLRLAKLVQRVDVLSQLAGFGVRRFEIVRTLRDLLLKIGILTPQCFLRRLLFGDGGGGWTG